MSSNYRRPRWWGGPCFVCGIRRAFKAGRMCGRCYSDPDNRALYVGERGIPQLHEFHARMCLFVSRPLGEPTTALPGTPEKVAVLEARVAAGLELFHPEDYVPT